MTTTSARGRVTIADVARAAGVSVPTVSKVLNGRDDVSPDTRTRVQDALDVAGYRRRGAVRPARTASEASGRGPLVDLVLTDLDSPYALEVLAGAETGASRAGAGLVVTAAHDGDGPRREWLAQVASHRSAGTVLVVNRFAGGSVEEVASLGSPVVLLDPVGGTDPSLPTVGATNFVGGVAATEHLLALGHRRIACITGRPDLLCSQERLEGWRAALARAGVEADESLVRAGDFQPGGGQQAAAELLDLPPGERPTAVFAGSDMQASGVYQEARARGLRVPQDLSVVGFDDVSICRYLSPPLTTVRQPLADMAAEAVRMVLEVARRGAGHRPPHLQLSTSLVVRESTAPPPRRPALTGADRR